MMYHYYIGLDTGVNTGISVWDSAKKEFLLIETTTIHRAMDWVKQYNDRQETFVRFEDARLRKWFGNAGREQLQGAGSIKRDAKIWEDFLKDIKCPFEAVAPKNNRTKLDADTFKKITKWEKQTNVHGRDSAMLVFQR
jgi:hypothetical protein